MIRIVSLGGSLDKGLSRSFCYTRAQLDLERALEQGCRDRQRPDAKGDQKEQIEADGGKAAILEKNGLEPMYGVGKGIDMGNASCLSSLYSMPPPIMTATYMASATEPAGRYFMYST